MIIYYITHTTTERNWERQIGGNLVYLLQKLERGEKPVLHFGETLAERILTDIITTCWDDVATHRPTAVKLQHMLGRYIRGTIQSVHPSLILTGQR